MGQPVYLSFDETDGPNPIAFANNSDHDLAQADGGGGLPTFYTYHGLQLTPLGGDSRLTDADLSYYSQYGAGEPFNANNSLIFFADTTDPAMGNFTITAATGSFEVFSLYTYAPFSLECGASASRVGQQTRRLVQCGPLGVKIIGTLAGAPVDACNVGTISFAVNFLAQYVVFPPGCVVDTLQFVPIGAGQLVVDNIVTCAATADSSLTLSA